MKQIEQRVYLSPEVVVSEIEVEQGFVLSNMEPIDHDKPEQEW